MEQAIDWSGIRASAVAIGVRPAARQAAVDLPEHERERFVERVMKRCSREGWIAAKSEAVATVTQATGTVAKPLSASVRTGADVLATRLADDSKQTRLGLSAAARKAATTFGRKTGQGVIKEAQALRHVTAAASQLHGWEQGKQGGLTLNLGVVVGGMQ